MVGWVTDSFVATGKTELPDGAYRWHPKYTGSLTRPDLEEMKTLFEDQESLNRFLAGEDFSYGLADVNDTEFCEHYETLVYAMKNLGMDGLVMELPRYLIGS